MDMWSGWGGSVFGALGGALIGVAIAIAVTRRSLAEQRRVAAEQLAAQSAATERQLAAQCAATERQLAAQSLETEKQLTAQAATHEAQLAAAKDSLERSLVFQAFGAYMSGILEMNDAVLRGRTAVRSAHRVAVAGSVQLEIALGGQSQEFVRLAQKIIDKMLYLALIAASPRPALEPYAINCWRPWKTDHWRPRN